MTNKLQERAILMRLSAGLPGEHRKDSRTTEEIKADKSLGKDAGKWIKDLYPKHALEPCKKIVAAAREYHGTVTLPFDVGIGILPAALIAQYQEKVGDFGYQLKLKAETFVSGGQDWVNWARQEHNGTFDPDNYPGCYQDSAGGVSFVPDEWQKKIGSKFYLRAEPLPVPNAEHFTAGVTQLLGVDAESVNIRVRDAGKEAQAELMRRLIAPVKAMADKLAEQPKGDNTGIIFRDSLVSNVQEIVDLAPALNLADDPQIVGFVREITDGLLAVKAQTLRDDANTRDNIAREAKRLCDKMSAYTPTW